MASAATDAAERGRASARFDTCVEVGLFVVLVAYLVRLPLGLQMSDESALLYEAKRIRDGEVMYRDFFQFVTPLASYTIAGAYWASRAPCRNPPC
jgi:hypothetical protein